MYALCVLGILPHIVAQRSVDEQSSHRPNTGFKPLYPVVFARVRAPELLYIYAIQRLGPQCGEATHAQQSPPSQPPQSWLLLPVIEAAREGVGGQHR